MCLERIEKVIDRPVLFRHIIILRNSLQIHQNLLISIGYLFDYIAKLIDSGK